MAAHAAVTRCPHCGGELYVEEAERLRPYVSGGFHVIGDPLPRQRVAVRVRACGGCEFIERLEDTWRP